MRKAFNAVIVKAGDQQLVEDARAAGLAVYVEMDRKSDFAKGNDISGDVQEIVRQVKEHPGTIAGIRVADRLNGGGLDPDEAVGYLEATGGVFHQEIPGVPVFADVVDWELTCGKRGQRNCVVLRFTRYRFEINKVLTRFYRSGHLDGFMLALDMEGEDPALVGAAFRKARALWAAALQAARADGPVVRQDDLPRQRGRGQAAHRHGRQGAAAGRRGRGGPVGLAPAVPGGDPHLPRQGRLHNPFWDQLVSVAVKEGVSA